MRKVTDIDRLIDSLDDIRLALNGIDGAMSRAERLAENVDGVMLEMPEVGAPLIEALSHGLLLVEGKYGSSSSEAQSVREFLSKAQDK